MESLQPPTTPTSRRLSFGFLQRLGAFLAKPLWGPGIKDLYFFCISLYSCLSSGVPIVKAFAVTAESTHHARLRRAAQAVGREVGRGVPVEKALRAHARLFSPFFINMFVTGLRSGDLVHTVDLLTEHYATMLALRSAILRVVWYPVFLLFAGACIMTARDLIICFMYRPFTWSEALVIIRVFFQPLVLGVVAAVVAARLVKSPAVRPATDEVIMRVPLLGGLYGQYSRAVFFESFAATVEAGVEVITGLNASIEAMDNHHLARRLARAEPFLRAGHSVAEAFEMTRALNGEALGMIHAGEVGGSLPELLRRLAGYYLTEVKTAFPGLIMAASPFLLFFVSAAYFVNPLFLGLGAFLMLFFLFLTF